MELSVAINIIIGVIMASMLPSDVKQMLISKMKELEAMAQKQEKPDLGKLAWNEGDEA